MQIPYTREYYYTQSVYSLFGDDWNLRFCALITVGALFYFLKEENKMSAPSKCPMCGESINWKKVDQQNKGFSVGKAAVGGILLGPVGLIGGALGKKKVYYYCGKCGFNHEYKA